MAAQPGEFSPFPKHSNNPDGGKGKGRPIKGHEGPEMVKSYSCTLSLSSALSGDGLSTPSLGCFTPGKDPVPIA